LCTCMAWHSLAPKATCHESLPPSGLGLQERSNRRKTQHWRHTAEAG
jgi:hypothetical protein